MEGRRKGWNVGARWRMRSRRGSVGLGVLVISALNTFVSSPLFTHLTQMDANVRSMQLREILDSKPNLIPAVNQIEVHPFNTQPEITSFCAQHNIVVEAYAPLARSLRANHPKIKELSKKYDCTWAQLMVKWGLQKGYVPLPKSVNEQRIKANADVDGFEISNEDVKTLDGLDEKLVTDWDPTDAD